MRLITKILCFNVESEEELYAINNQASLMKLIANVSIRVNPDVKVETHPYISTGMREISLALHMMMHLESTKKPKL